MVSVTLDSPILLIILISVQLRTRGQSKRISSLTSTWLLQEFQVQPGRVAYGAFSLFVQLTRQRLYAIHVERNSLEEVKLPRRTRRPTSKSTYTRDTEHKYSMKSLNCRKKPEQLRKQVVRVWVYFLVTANKYPLNLFIEKQLQFSFDHPKSREIQKLIAEFIAVDNQPFSVVDDVGLMLMLMMLMSVWSII